MDPGRGHQGPGEGPAHRPSAGPAVPHQGTARHRHPLSAYADGLAFDFVCGDEVYGSCTGLREFLEEHGQAYYMLRVASSFPLTRHRDAVLAGLIISAFEGALVLSRAARSMEPFNTTTAALIGAIDHDGASQGAVGYDPAGDRR